MIVIQFKSKHFPIPFYKSKLPNKQAELPDCKQEDTNALRNLLEQII